VRFVGAAFIVSTAGFLGYGAQPPATDWGLMVLENRDGLSLQPLAVAVPAAGILLLLLSANLLVDAAFPATARRRRATAPAAGSADRSADGLGGAVDGLADGSVLRLRGLTVDAPGADGLRRIVAGVDLDVAPGRILALVGPSGSGKTTVALAALGELRPGLVLRDGSVQLAGQAVLGLSERALRRLRSRHARYVPQDPRTSLTPTMRVADQIGEFLRARGGAPGRAAGAAPSGPADGPTPL
jgi:hypothetical protein